MVVQDQTQAKATSGTDTKGCASDISVQDTMSCAYPCHVDGQPCMVIAPLASPEVEKALRLTVSCLPCTSCPRPAEHALARLEGVRLGKHEWRVLLVAAPPDAEAGAVIAPPTEGRAADEAQRRAIRRLATLGQAHVGHARVSTASKVPFPSSWGLGKDYVPRRDYWHLAVWQSPLGAAVVGRLRVALETGQRIRWPLHRAALAVATRRTAQELRMAFRGHLDDLRKRDMELAGLEAQLGHRVSGQKHLESVRACVALMAALDAQARE